MAPLYWLDTDTTPVGDHRVTAPDGDQDEPYGIHEFEAEEAMAAWPRAPTQDRLVLPLCMDRLSNPGAKDSRRLDSVGDERLEHFAGRLAT